VLLYQNNDIYIVGKAKDLKDRLSGYNKIAEHEVVHYKSCMNENDMKVIEQIVLNKLDKYRQSREKKQIEIDSFYLLINLFLYSLLLLIILLIFITVRMRIKKK